MAWTDAQRMFYMYAIAEVESGWQWTSVNTGDPITVGIMQWYGGRAAALCARLKTDAPDSYGKLSGRIRSAVEDMGNVNWDRFWLTEEDANSWVAAAGVEANHVVQQAQALEDLDSYLDTLGYWGVNTENVKNAIMLISAYHQSPAACLRVIRNIGGDRDFDATCNAILGDKTLGSYVRRYNTIRERLAAWDGKSSPPDFGQVDPDNVPNETTPSEDESTSLQSSVAYVETVGNDLVIHGTMSTTSKLLCHNTGRGIWVPVASTIPDQPSQGGGDKPDTPTPPATGEPADWAACKALWEEHENEWAYSNAAGRTNPPVSGYSDCSACIWWAVNAATNGKYDWMGTRSYTMRDTATLIRKFDPDEPLDTSDMRPGDLIIMTYGPGSSIGNGLGHVDWYWGGNTIWSAGYAPLPHHQTDDLDTYYQRNNGRWKISDIGIYRFLE